MIIMTQKVDPCGERSDGDISAAFFNRFVNAKS
jgi:hypothetical protein